MLVVPTMSDCYEGTAWPKATKPSTGKKPAYAMSIHVVGGGQVEKQMAREGLLGKKRRPRTRRTR